MTPDNTPTIQIDSELIIVRGFDDSGNPIVDVLQHDGTHKLMHTETIWEQTIEGPVAMHFSPDGTVSFEKVDDWDDDDDA